ncbi:MAG: hypothetical protein JO034_20575 [Singulisphaera sp.]|nr:hypothetical protein [Singulisphaera sp.]
MSAPRYTMDELERDGLYEVTIHPSIDEYTGVTRYEVVGHGLYPDHSVLAGQYRRCVLDVCASAAEALAAYPGARLEGPKPPLPPLAMHGPPAWFSPADAGESWDEV